MPLSAVPIANDRAVTIVGDCAGHVLSVHAKPAMFCNAKLPGSFFQGMLSGSKRFQV